MQGIDIPTPDTFKDAQDPTGIKKTVDNARKTREWMPRVNGSQAEIFDLVLLRVRGYPWHIGTYIGEGRMINSNRHADSCIESLTGLKWVNNVLGYYYYAH